MQLLPPLGVHWIAITVLKKLTQSLPKTSYQYRMRFLHFDQVKTFVKMEIQPSRQ